MKEYIEREKVLHFCREIINSHQSTQRSRLIANSFNNFAVFVNNLPAADVRENVRGEWVERETLGRIYHICSACGKPPRRHVDYETSYELSDFCPNCGAQMEAAI